MTPPAPLDPFEQRLAATPPRALPPGWRTRILANARAAERPRLRISQLLWPHPLAWGALAAAWLAIAALNFTGPRGEELYAVTPAESRARLPTAQEYLVQLEWQRRLFLALAAEPPATEARHFLRRQDL